MGRVLLVIVLALAAVSAISLGCSADVAGVGRDRGVQVINDGLMSVEQLGDVEQERPRCVPGEIVFKLAEAGGKTGIQSQSVQAALAGAAVRNGLTDARPVAAGSTRGAWRNVFRARLRSSESPIDAAERMKADPAIEWAEPNYYRYVTLTPNDPFYTSQSHLSLVSASAAWNITTGSADVVIAVIDTGVQWNHPDLAANIWTNTGEVAGDGIDNDGNGYADDVRGWDFVSVASDQVYSGEDPGPADNDPADFVGHGTHVAGIAGAVGNNGTGVAGLNWQVRIMPLRAGYKNKSGQGVLESTDVANALAYAADNGAHVVNMSFGGPDTSHVERAAIDYCIAAGVLLVASAGNDTSDRPSYPAAFGPVLAVSSVDSSKVCSYFSNWGTWVDIAAPGESLRSTYIGDAYQYSSGTSMASPVVAGIAGLVKAIHPTWTATDLKLHLQGTTLPISNENPGYVNLLGSGLVKANMAVIMATPPVRAGATSLWAEETTGTSDGCFDTGETIELLPSFRNFGVAVEGGPVSLTTTSPYVTIIDGAMTVDGLGIDITRTSRTDPLSISIAPGTPYDHIASLKIGADPIPVRLNPLMRNTAELAKHHDGIGYVSPVVTPLSDGSLVVTCSTSGFTENQVYARTADASGNWGALTKVSTGTAFSNAREQQAATGTDDRVHVSFIGVLGSWQAELFYMSRDPVTGTWSAPVKITNGTEIYQSTIPGLEAPHTIAVNPQGNHPYAVWADYRTGAPELYYVGHDGSAWSAESRIIVPSTTDVRRLFLAFTPAGVGHLLWTQKDGTGIYSVHMMTLSGDTWSTPVTVADNLPSSSLAAEMDSLGRLHIAYSYPTDDGIAYRGYNGSWSAASQVIEHTYVHGPSPILAAGPDDSVHVLWEDYLDLSLGDETQLCESVYNGASWSSPAQLTFDRGGEASGDKDYAIAPDGTRLLGESMLLSPRGGSSSDCDLVLLSSSRDASLLPSRPVVADGGDTTGNPFTISASWSSSHASGIAEYQYAVGTAPGGTDVVYWQSAGAATSMTVDLSNTPLMDGQSYYVNVKARNGNCYWSPIGVSDGLLHSYVEPVRTPAGVKAAADGVPVDMRGAAVTVAFPDFAYVEADDRASGVRVEKASHGLSVGDRADVYGLTATNADGERCVAASAVYDSGSGSVEPIGMTNRALGGGPSGYDPGTGSGQQGIEGAAGPNNIGLLVRTWGVVTSSGTVLLKNLETDPGWSRQGQWAYGVPTGGGGTAHGKPDPTSGHTGASVFGVNLSGDYSLTAGGPWYLTTGPINCSSCTGTQLKFWRWLNTDIEPFAYATVEVSNDGSTWTTVWHNANYTTADSSWRPCSYDIGAVADGHSTVYVRWGYKVGSSAWAYSGWNLDDIEVTASGMPCVIDDGSGVGGKLVLPPGAAAPAVGEIVGVTGASSCEKGEDQKLRPVIRVRNADSMQRF